MRANCIALWLPLKNMVGVFRNLKQKDFAPLDGVSYYKLA